MNNCVLLKLGVECHGEKYLHLRHYLSDKNFYKINKYVFQIDENRSLMAEMLVIKILKDLYQVDNNKLSHTTTGRPYLKRFPDIKISISHSGDWVGVFFSDKFLNVGLDIQKISSYTNKTISIILGGDIDTEDNYLLTKLWCFKEAYVKYTGMGFRAMDSMLKINEENVDVKNDIFFHSVSIDNEYVLGVALPYRERLQKINIIKVDWNNFSDWLWSLK